jgi:hypothetical protein
VFELDRTPLFSFQRSKDQRHQTHALTNYSATNRPDQYIVSTAVVKNFFNLFSNSMFAAFHLIFQRQNIVCLYGHATFVKKIIKLFFDPDLMISFLAGPQHQGLIRRQVGGRDQAVVGINPLPVHVGPALADEPPRSCAGGGQPGFVK